MFVKNILVIAVITFVFSGCTSIKINNQNGFNPNSLQQVCVIDNPQVTVPGFNESIIQAFSKHNVQAKLYPFNSKPQLCQTVMRYTALRSWDVVTYLSYAKFTLERDGRILSEAEFRLKGKGGMALNKWRSTDKKVQELVDQLMEKES